MGGGGKWSEKADFDKSFTEKIASILSEEILGILSGNKSTTDSKSVNYRNKKEYLRSGSMQPG